MMKSALKKRKGQGVVEYAGALVVAAVIVGAALSFGPTMINTIFNQVQTRVTTLFTP
jgi:Flp pilus assembly pilin Flp